MLRSSISVSNQMNCEMKCFVTFGFLYAFVAVHGFKNSVVDYKYLIFNLSIVCSPLGNPSYYLNFKQDFIV